MDPITSFSVSSTHIAFAAKSPYLNVESHTREDVYILPLHLSSWAIQPSHHTPGTHGAINGVTFSPDGMQLAELEMAKDEYESYRLLPYHLTHANHLPHPLLHRHDLIDHASYRNISVTFHQLAHVADGLVYPRSCE